MNVPPLTVRMNGGPPTFALPGLSVKICAAGVGVPIVVLKLLQPPKAIPKAPAATNLQRRIVPDLLPSSPSLRATPPAAFPNPGADEANPSPTLVFRGIRAILEPFGNPLRKFSGWDNPH